MDNESNSNNYHFLDKKYEIPSDRIPRDRYRRCDVKEWISDFQGLLKDITNEAESLLTPDEYKNFIYDSSHPAG